MYDIIGDIHGYADELEAVLQKMGYRKKGSTYCHPDNRKAVFVGDFIDRGPKIRQTLHLVREMQEADQALAVMGNHEFNALCYHTPDPKTGGFLREHSEKNIRQHSDTLEAFNQNESELEDFLEWFKTLPLYLDLEPFRVVHACWDQAHIDWLEGNYEGMTPKFLHAASDRDQKSKEYMVIEDILKGKESSLPEGVTMTDKEGHVRKECRVRWWTPPDQRERYGDVLIECPNELTGRKLNSDKSFHTYEEEKPVFFGHYWLDGEPQLGSSNAVCLDYSVANGGALVAFRWEGDGLEAGRFVEVKNQTFPLS